MNTSFEGLTASRAFSSFRHAAVAASRSASVVVGCVVGASIVRSISTRGVGGNRQTSVVLTTSTGSLIDRCRDVLACTSWSHVTLSSPNRTSHTPHATDRDRFRPYVGAPGVAPSSIARSVTYMTAA